MPRRPALLLAAVLAGAVVTSGCRAAPQVPRADVVLPPPAAGPAAVTTLPDGSELRPGVDGTLPVEVRWTHFGSVPEALAADPERGLLYLDDELATGLDLETGDVEWQVGSPEDSPLEGGLGSDGGDVIGPTGEGHVRFFAPYSFDLVVDPASGERVRFEYAPGDVPTDFATFEPDRVRVRWKIEVGPDEVVARRAGGQVAWTIACTEPAWIYGVGPVEIPGGLALALGTGLVVVLDRVGQ